VIGAAPAEGDDTGRTSPAAALVASALVLVGAVLLAAGVGLVQFPIETGLSLGSVTCIVLCAGGVAAIALGARRLLAGRRVVVRIGIAVLVLLLVLWSVATIGPAVAATKVVPTEIGPTPASVGLEHRSVTLRTSDGVLLAGWYVEGTLGAGLVVRHGSGSTRSAVLDQAAALARSGYSILLLDARGHGDSEGVAMDFGWNGDLDVAAGTAFLASRPEVDPRRIGVVGFSMGGEEAIGAAAADERIRAVVAEGATARQAEDKAWLSDEYGWRGWVQERIEDMQYGVTDLLTDAPHPIALRRAIADATGTHFLLIAGGDADGEERSAEHLRSGAVDRVSVWVADGAGHVGAYRADPQEWQRRVVEFLDQRLR
jgi:dienelactone hydrolase